MTLEIAVSDFDIGWLSTSRRNVRLRKASASSEINAGGAGFSDRGFDSFAVFAVLDFVRAGRLGTGAPDRLFAVDLE